MKHFVACLTILAFTGVSAFAKTLAFPNKGDTMFKITIPDDWEPDSDDDEVVEATSPKNHVGLSIWEITSKEEIDNLEKDLVEILEDHAKEIKLVGEPKKIMPGGMEGLLFEGTALDEEDGHKIEFFALFIIGKKKVAVVFIEADAATPKKELEKLTDILKSIKQPTSK